VIEVRAEWRMKTDAPVEPLVENNFIRWRLSLKMPPGVIPMRAAIKNV
jgi:hypothetical protein